LIDLIKLPQFHHFYTALKSAEEVKGASPETDVVRWTFKDGTVQEVKQEEHSVCLQPVDCMHSMRRKIKDIRRETSVETAFRTSHSRARTDEDYNTDYPPLYHVQRDYI
jgi:hypothetical protein